MSLPDSKSCRTHLYKSVLSINCATTASSLQALFAAYSVTKITSPTAIITQPVIRCTSRMAAAELIKEATCLTSNARQILPKKGTHAEITEIMTISASSRLSISKNRAGCQDRIILPLDCQSQQPVRQLSPSAISLCRCQPVWTCWLCQAALA